MPTPRRYPDRTMTNAERAALSRARAAEQQAAILAERDRLAALLHRIATDDTLRTLADARRVARQGMEGADA